MLLSHIEKEINELSFDEKATLISNLFEKLEEERPPEYDGLFLNELLKRSKVDDFDLIDSELELK